MQFMNNLLTQVSNMCNCFNKEYLEDVKINFNNGDKYEGEFRKGEKHGEGSYFYRNGDIYMGNWINNLK